MVNVDLAGLATARSEGFEQATAEKVARLLGILREVQALSHTKDRFTLKGGTALNVFHFPKAPRLSVDLDLMVTGFPSASPGSDERRQVLGHLHTLVRSLGYTVSEQSAQAAVAIACSYRNSLGSPDRIKIDLDLLNRMTLLPSVSRSGPELFPPTT